MFRSRRFWISILLVFVLFLVGINERKVLAQSDDSRYFRETGHWVTGEFLAKYDEVANPVTLYGNPITEAFEDSVSGRTIQYFEKTRFELHPESPTNLRVKLTPLGEYLYEAGQPLPISTNSPACRTFIESDFPVCYTFLDFFEAHGGIAQFGYPISGFEIHDGWIVQYFQNVRFEWHPENPPGQWVTISNLGFRYFHNRNEDPTRLNPVSDEGAPASPVLWLRTHAFVSKPLLSVKGPQNQKIFIIVQDQYRNPVSNATVDFTVTLPDNTTKEFKANNTNQAGISTLNFSLPSGSTGIASIYIEVSYSDNNELLTGHTYTSYRIWW